MNFLFADVVALSRALVALAGVSLVACSATPKVSDPGVFELTEGARRARFPEVETIGVVELSGARIKERAFKGVQGDREYLATGGALLIKRVEKPILAQAPEILVTPEAAVLRGKQAMVKSDGKLIRAESEGTEIVIDGTEVKIDGPHSIRSLSTGKTVVAGTTPKAAPPEPMSASPAKPEPMAAAKTSARPTAVKPAPKPVAKAAPRPAVKPVVKPAEAKVDRQELLNLMREPSE